MPPSSSDTRQHIAPAIVEAVKQLNARIQPMAPPAQAQGLADMRPVSPYPMTMQHPGTAQPHAAQQETAAPAQAQPAPQARPAQAAAAAVSPAAGNEAITEHAIQVTLPAGRVLSQFGCYAVTGLALPLTLLCEIVQHLLAFHHNGWTIAWLVQDAHHDFKHARACTHLTSVAVVAFSLVSHGNLL